MAITIKKGLSLPISGVPENTIEPGHKVSTVAVLGIDYNGMKPTMLINEGDQVKRGQPLFEDKKNPGVIFTSPGGGKIQKINRGAKRALQSVVIELAEAGSEEDITFENYESSALDSISGEQVRENLIKSGSWTAFRTRPYSKIPAVDSTPNSIFVTAIDTRPLAADPAQIIGERSEAFNDGLKVLKKLTEGKVFVCKAAGAEIDVKEDAQVQVEEFSGPHPAGLVGTHIHYLDPVVNGKVVWAIGYQDVIAFGKLFVNGKIWVERILSLGGPVVPKPRLLQSRLGANIEEMVAQELIKIECRVISGSVFSGHHAQNWSGYLGRYHTQISVLAEGRERELLGWIMPGANKFSATRAFLSSIIKPKEFKFTTTQNGSPRAMVPFGAYESIFPLRMLPTQLLRALIVRDTDSAQALGCLELDEEDLGLCSYVCPGKHDYGKYLRMNLEQIEKEG